MTLEGVDGKVTLDEVGREDGGGGGDTLLCLLPKTRKKTPAEVA